MQVFFALTMTAMGVSGNVNLIPDRNKVKSSVDSIFNILDSKPKIDSSSDGGSTIDTVNGAIKFQNVSFKYPCRPDCQIFTDLCLSIPSGKVSYSKTSHFLTFTSTVLFFLPIPN